MDRAGTMEMNGDFDFASDFATFLPSGGFLWPAVSSQTIENRAARANEDCLICTFNAVVAGSSPARLTIPKT